MVTDIRVAAWNSRGLLNATPYIQLLSEDFGILAICEHWLWPFELFKLNQLVPGYRSVGCCDKRLSETSNLTRGCGGVALLWKSSIPASPVSTLSSDRLVAIQIQVNPGVVLSVIAVYLPTSDTPLETHSEYLFELENAVAALQSQGPVLILGDFNAHLGSCNSDGGSEDMNPQGQLLREMMSRNDLFPVSLSQLASGPSYTFFSGDKRTTVDYCLLDCGASHLVSDCSILDHHPLNLSDHLPVTISLELHAVGSSEGEHCGHLDWKKGRADGSVNDYEACVRDQLMSRSDLYGAPLASVQDVEVEINDLTKILKQAALDSIPRRTLHRAKKKYVHDDHLRSLCKSAWRKWRDAGRPRNCPLHDLMKNAKRNVKEYVRICRGREERAELQRRDRLFCDKDTSRFRLPRKPTVCRKLVVDGKCISEPDDLLNCWRLHFSSLAESQVSSTHESGVDIHGIEARSFGINDSILDSPLTEEEIELALKKLKLGKSGSFDGLLSEHLRFAGQPLIPWLKWIFNSICSLEVIPQCLKVGTVVPVFKGKGRDPTRPGNY